MRDSLELSVLTSCNYKQCELASLEGPGPGISQLPVSTETPDTLWVIVGFALNYLRRGIPIVQPAFDTYVLAVYIKSSSTDLELGGLIFTGYRSWNDSIRVDINSVLLIGPCYRD